MYFVFIYENRRMKLVEIVLRRGKREMMEGINLIYIVNTYANITMYLLVQLLHAKEKRIN
jgi:hypothetical protein